MNDFMQRGYAAVKAHNIPAAVQWFEKAWKENPDDPQAQAWLGQSLCSTGQRNEGVAHLRQAGTHFLRDSLASKDMGLVLEVASQLQHWGDFQGALELLNQ
jgi:tetratricopeptide (TPR) repeat protein